MEEDKQEKYMRLKLACLYFACKPKQKFLDL